MSLVLLAVAQLATICFAQCNDPAAIEKALQEMVSFVVKNAALVETLDLLAQHIQAELPDFEIKILADDLKLEGVTQNQIIRQVKLDDVPLAEVLTAIAMAANPNKAARSPADPQMKVIWTIGPDPNNAQRQIVLITTRAAAARRGDKLPDCFKPPV